MHSQFTVVPPLEKVKQWFQQMTGKTFLPDTCWSSWKFPTAEQYDILRQYYRQCHITVLEDTITGKYETPCVLLRQLVRPHNFRIETAGKKTWILRDSSIPLQKGVGTREGTTVVWND